MTTDSGRELPFSGTLDLLRILEDLEDLEPPGPPRDGPAPRRPR
ncbi:hypothetical protein [Pseudonocardia terrae]|nr:hypothetical protein [Pseudonocardia terrae]